MADSGEEKKTAKKVIRPRVTKEASRITSEAGPVVAKKVKLVKRPVTVELPAVKAKKALKALGPRVATPSETTPLGEVETSTPAPAESSHTLSYLEQQLQRYLPPLTSIDIMIACEETMKGKGPLSLYLWDQKGSRDYLLALERVANDYWDDLDTRLVEYKDLDEVLGGDQKPWDEVFPTSLKVLLLSQLDLKGNLSEETQDRLADLVSWCQGHEILVFGGGRERPSARFTQDLMDAWNRGLIVNVKLDIASALREQGLELEPAIETWIEDRFDDRYETQGAINRLKVLAKYHEGDLDLAVVEENLGDLIDS